MCVCVYVWGGSTCVFVRADTHTHTHTKVHTLTLITYTQAYRGTGRSYGPATVGFPQPGAQYFAAQGYPADNYATGVRACVFECASTQG